MQVYIYIFQIEWSQVRDCLKVDKTFFSDLSRMTAKSKNQMVSACLFVCLFVCGSTTRKTIL